jgi:hypothetical protein
MQTFLSNSDAKALKNLVGSTFNFVGGLWLPDFLSSGSIVVSTSAGAWSISGELKDLFFEGFEDEYSSISISNVTEDQLEKIKDKGNTYLRNLTGVIRNVLVAREEIREFSGEIQNWTYEKDFAIIINLGTASLVIELISHGSETMRARAVDNFKLEDLVPPVEHWDEDLFVSYERKLKLVSLAEENFSK